MRKSLPAESRTLIPSAAALACAGLALILAAPARAWDIEDGTWVAGIDGGFGSPRGGAANALGRPGIVGGQALYHPQSEYALGLQVDRFDFKSKGPSKADMTSILAMSRGNFGGTHETYLPYALFGVGYAESRADVPNGADYGSGFAFCLGAGLDRMFGKTVGVGAEVRIHRLGAPLPRLGLSGATVADVVLRLNLWLPPGGDPFRRKG